MITTLNKNSQISNYKYTGDYDQEKVAKLIHDSLFKKKKLWK